MRPPSRVGVPLYPWISRSETMLNPQDSPRFRVLLLSGDPEISWNLTGMLDSDPSTSICTTDDSIELVSLHQELHASLIIIDSACNLANVVSLVQVLRRIDDRTRLLLLITHEEVASITSVLVLGNITYLIRPVDAGALRKYVSARLGLETI